MDLRILETPPETPKKTTLKGPIHAPLKRNLPRPPILKFYGDTPSHTYSPPFDFILFLDCSTFMPTTFSTLPYAYFQTIINFWSFRFFPFKTFHTTEFLIFNLFYFYPHAII